MGGNDAGLTHDCDQRHLLLFSMRVNFFKAPPLQPRSLSFPAIILLMLAFSPDVEASMSPWDSLEIPFFSHLTLQRELPNLPTALAQDADGFIWIGTQSGLVQWDGYRGRIFSHDTKKPNSLPSDFVNQLVVSARGNLYVATNDRVSRYDPVGETFAQLPVPPGGSFQPLAVDRDEGLWIGDGEGLWYLAPGAMTWVAIDTGGAREVGALLITRSGAVWVGAGGNLLRRPPSGSLFERMEKIPKNGKISAFLQSADGRVWIGTDHGQLLVATESGLVRQVSIPTSNALVGSITELKGNQICVGLVNQGLIFLDSRNFNIVREVHANPARPEALASNSIEVSLVDRDGGLWIAHDRGVDYLRGKSDTFQTVGVSPKEQTAFDERNVTALLPLGALDLWIGSDRHAALMNLGAGTRRSIPREPEARSDALPNTWVKDFAVTPGRLWVGTHGLFEVTKSHVTRFAPLSDEGVFALAADTDHLWVGLRYRGLARISLHDFAVTRYRHEAADVESISDDTVQALLIDKPRGIWVATTHGLDLFDEKTGKFRTFTHIEGDSGSLPSDNVDTLFLDDRHRLWVGTFGGGAAVMVDYTAAHTAFKKIGLSEGLPDANVDRMIADGHGRIWASTDHGIAMIDPQTLRATSFGQSDGVNIMSHWSNAGALMQDGTILFGGNGGITVVHPDEKFESSGDPPLRVTSIKIGASHVAPSTVLELGKDDRALQVEFAALDYAASGKIKYAYKLDGIDKEWIETDSDHRFAAYTNLPPGKYQLTINSTNRSGIWGAYPISIGVQVTARWYQTWWYYCCLTVAAAFLVLIVVRGRTVLLLRQRRDLERRVAERTRELESAKEALEQLATQDGLTKIGNRRRFDMVLEQEFGRAVREDQPLSLLLIDVDDFKAYNDSYGHQAGDEVLRRIARLCQSTLRRSTDLAARYGGEEFGVILPQVHLLDALELARSIVTAVGAAQIDHQAARAAKHVTVSIGVACAGGFQSVGTEELVAGADSALYMAKQQGRNRAVASPSSEHNKIGSLPLKAPKENAA